MTTPQPGFIWREEANKGLRPGPLPVGLYWMWLGRRVDPSAPNGKGWGIWQVAAVDEAWNGAEAAVDIAARHRDCPSLAGCVEDGAPFRLDRFARLEPGINLTPRDRTLRELQSSLPWTAHYHRDFRASPQTHKDFGHALLHIHKAGGKLAAILDDAEHKGFAWEDPANRADVGKYVADMVICALRLATTCPDGQLDLQRLVEDRLTAKNNQLAVAKPDYAAGERA